MLCRSARSALVDSEGGALGARRRARLDRHLARCPVCAAEELAGRQIAEELARLRVAPPFEIDVRARVAARIAASAPGRRAEVSAAQLAWAIGGGSAVVALLVAFSAGGPVDPASAWREAASAAGGLGRAMAPVGTLIAGLASAAAQMLGALIAAAAGLAAPLRSLAWVATGFAMATMAATIALVVGRDVLRAGFAGHGPARRHGP
jgi:hypothetical protein